MYLRLFVLITAAIWLAATAALADGESAEADFEVRPYASGLDEPVAMAFAPDGRLFVAEKGGGVRIIRDGTVLEPPFATVDVHDFLESGLLGLTLDPDFENNHYVYVFATVSLEEQNIIRYTDEGGAGTNATVIRRHLPSRGSFHNGGCLKVGPDGKLYFSIGDNAVGDLAQDMNSLAGKICRINLDGSTPSDNPFTTPLGSPRASYALGFRNPFRFCFAPDGRLFAIDVGSDGAKRREEVNLVRQGDNCGWPVVEGTADANTFPQYVNPIYDYQDKGSAPAGIVYYSGRQYPESYVGSLFHLEHTLNRVYRIVLDGDRAVSHTRFVQAEGGPVDLVQGPDGCLYYCELITGNIKQIRYTGGTDPGTNPADDDVFSTGLCGTGTAMLNAGALVLLWTQARRRRWTRPRRG